MCKHILSVFIGIILPVIFLILPISALAQISEAEILLSGNYHWGEGYAESRDNAVNAARVDLIEKMVVVIDSETRSDVQETADAFQSEFASRTRSLSRMQLRGLNYKNIERRDGTWKSIAYISKSDYRQTLEEEKNKLSNLLNQAYRMERRSGLQQAIPVYSELMVERQFYPEPFYTSTDIQGVEMDIARFSRSRMSAWMDDITIEVRRAEVYGDGSMDETNLTLELMYEGRPVNHLKVGLDRSGFGMLEVVDGMVNVFMDVLPDAREVTYRLVLQPIFPRSDNDLQAIADQTLPEVRRRVNVSFEDHINIDFTVTRIGTGGYQFNPRIENLAVSDLRWEFGDGRSSTQSAPRHVFSESDEMHIVSLRVNRDDLLITKKELHPDGTLRRYKEPDREPASREMVSRHDDRNVSGSRAASGRSADPGSARPATARETADPAEYHMPIEHRDVVEELKRSRSYSQVVGRLSTYQSQNKLQFGDRQTVGDVAGCYVLIINTERREVAAFLSPEVGNKRQNMLTNELISDVSEKYRGMAPLWVRIH